MMTVADIDRIMQIKRKHIDCFTYEDNYDIDETDEQELIALLRIENDEEDNLGIEGA